ncbi:MAG: hypothetical protein ACKVPX_11090 [Myxococcaceae bacterium]
MNFRVLASVGLLGLACETPKPEPIRPRPEVLLENVQMRSFRGERLMAVGSADRVVYARASADVEGTHARVRLPRRFQSGQRSPGDIGGVEISAPAIEGNLASQYVEGSEGVEVRTASGISGKTPKARYDGPTMTATGDAQVLVEGANFDLQAMGFVFRANDDVFEFGGPVDSHISGRP